jgi:hypothetical protein
VEHVCEKCGAGVEDGTPFCPQCNAPQIRVGLASADAYGEGDSAGHTRSISHSLPSRLVWRDALWSALGALAGAVLTVLLWVPPVLAMLLAGFLSVLLYWRRKGSFGLWTGTKLGALTGALGFLIPSTILGLAAAGGLRQEIQDAFLKELQLRASGPYASELIEISKTPDGLTILMIVSLTMTLLSFLFLSGLGGFLGALFLRQKNRI